MSSDVSDAVTGEGHARQGLVPRLRFPEFRDAGEWKLRELSELLTEPKVKNRRLEYGPEHVLSVSGEHGCVNQIDFLGRSYAGASIKEYNVVETGDIVYTKSPLKACPNGIIKANKGATGIVSVLYAVYRPTEAAKSEFLDHYFSSDHKLNAYLQPLVKKGPKNSILVNNSDVLKGRIGAPETYEQQKIADCLSSLDALIAAEGERLAALKKHKKGLLQALFPAEGQTIPRLRFPEFRDAGEWETTTLGRLSQIVRGGSPRPIESYLTTEPGGLNWLKIGDVEKDAKFISSTADKVIPEALSMTRVVLPGDLILSNSMSFGRPYILHIETCIHDGWIAITKISKEAERDYLYYQISAQGSQKYFKANAAGSSVQNLNADIIKMLPITLPKHAEQQKIGACLSSLDALIAAKSERLAALRKLKQSVMQQLFPSPAEVAA